MTVIIQKSVCHDCVWKDSCGSLKKIDDMRDRRNNPGHINSLFEAIIIQCSMKDYDRSFSIGKKDSSLFYCIECGSMHRNDSRIGILHKKKMEDQRKEDQSLREQRVQEDQRLQEQMVQEDQRLQEQQRRASV